MPESGGSQIFQALFDRLDASRRPMTIIGLLLPPLLGICTALSFPDPLRSNFDRVGEAWRDWLVLFAHIAAWAILTSIVLHFIRRHRAVRRRIRIDASRSARRSAATTLNQPERQRPLSPYSQFDEVERAIIRTFIDRGLQELGPRAFSGSDQQSTLRNSWALDRLIAREFLTYFEDEIGLHGGTCYKLRDMHFRYLSEHPDEIESVAPVRTFGRP